MSCRRNAIILRCQILKRPLKTLWSKTANSISMQCRRWEIACRDQTQSSRSQLGRDWLRLFLGCCVSSSSNWLNAGRVTEDSSFLAITGTKATKYRVTMPTDRSNGSLSNEDQFHRVGDLVALETISAMSCGEKSACLFEKAIFNINFFRISNSIPAHEQEHFCC